MRKITEKKIKSLLREEIKNNGYHVYENENGFTFDSLFLEKQIFQIEDVHEINLIYENIKNHHMTIDYFEKLWNLKRGFKLDWFQNVSQEVMEFRGEEYYYKLLGDVLVDIEFFHDAKYDILDLLRFGINPRLMMNEVENLSFDNLPDSLTIYRGFSIKDDKLDIEDFVSLSWTLDYNKAVWFSDRHCGLKQIILKCEIKKDEVLSYFTRRKESEIIVDFEILENNRIEIIEIKKK
jgi:hypothetical protein